MKRERESILHAGVIPKEVIHVKLFLDHFRLQKSQEDRELTNPVTRISHSYKRGFYEEIFLPAQCKCHSVSSRVAQRKRAGPITQRSEDQNLSLLVIVLSINMSKDHLLLISLSSTK